MISIKKMYIHLKPQRRTMYIALQQEPPSGCDIGKNHKRIVFKPEFRSSV